MIHPNGHLGVILSIFITFSSLSFFLLLFFSSLFFFHWKSIWNIEKRNGESTHTSRTSCVHGSAAGRNGSSWLRGATLTVPASPFNWINVRVFSRAGIRARTKPRRLFRAPIDRSNFHSIPGDSNRDQRKTTRPSDNSQRFPSRYSLRFTTSFSSLNIFLSFFSLFFETWKTPTIHTESWRNFSFFFFSPPPRIRRPKSKVLVRQPPFFFLLFFEAEDPTMHVPPRKQRTERVRERRKQVCHTRERVSGLCGVRECGWTVRGTRHVLVECGWPSQQTTPTPRKRDLGGMAV